MILHDAETDKAFTAPIDCKFPYDDPSASKIISQGWQVSLNAAFCVLHELCRPPRDSAVHKERLRELVSAWAEGPDHPLKAPVVGAANALINGTSLEWREGVELMRRVGEFDGQRAALAIVYFASYCEAADGDEALTRTDAEIRRRWEASGV
ncbi:MAG TPA: hypothetical protein VFH89_12075 [Sphingomicrobium sp.]|nr:hypothetical protein [Sphingomicrobium sp.]